MPKPVPEPESEATVEQAGAKEPSESGIVCDDCPQLPEQGILLKIVCEQCRNQARNATVMCS